MTPDVENAVVSPILPFLFLGNERDAQDLDLLLRLNIGYVVNVTTHLPLYHLGSSLIHYKRLPATDNSKQNLRQYFEEVFEFIGELNNIYFHFSFTKLWLAQCGFPPSPNSVPLISLPLSDLGLQAAEFRGQDARSDPGIEVPLKLQ